ncbi:MAG: DUF1826 domain-containing protein [Pseudomonadota bacterium]
MKPLVDRTLATISPAGEENVPVEVGAPDYREGSICESWDVPGVHAVDAPEALTSIARPDCDAVIWQRAPLASFQTWIDTLAPEKLPAARLILRPAQVHAAVQQCCDLAGTPDDAERARLVDDVTALAHVFADSMGVPFVRVRLDVVTGNACSKFHTDAVRARLICTYRGTGTQVGRLGADAARGTEPEDVRTVPTSAPMILRGTLWPSTHTTRLLHRSPPIKGTGETRLLLVLDPVEDTFAEIDHTRH